MKWLKYHFLPLVFFKLHLKEHGCVVVCPLHEVPTYFEDIEDAYSVSIEMIFLTQAQYEAMPEFQGY